MAMRDPNLQAHTIEGLGFSGADLARGAFAVSSLALAAVCALIAVAERAPASDLARQVARVAPLAGPRLTLAEAIATTPARRAELPVAGRAVDEALQLSPGRLGAWMVKEDVLIAANGGTMNDEAIAALAHSYAMSPLDYTYGPGRITLAYNHWNDLPADLRAKVSAETVCLRAAEPQRIDLVPTQVARGLSFMAAYLDVRRAQRGGSPCTPR